MTEAMIHSECDVPLLLLHCERTPFCKSVCVCVWRQGGEILRVPATLHTSVYCHSQQAAHTHTQKDKLRMSLKTAWYVKDPKQTHRPPPSSFLRPPPPSPSFSNSSHLLGLVDGQYGCDLTVLVAPNTLQREQLGVWQLRQKMLIFSSWCCSHISCCCRLLK